MVRNELSPQSATALPPSDISDPSIQLRQRRFVRDRKQRIGRRELEQIERGSAGAEANDAVQAGSSSEGGSIDGSRSQPKALVASAASRNGTVPVAPGQMTLRTVTRPLSTATSRLPEFSPKSRTALAIATPAAVAPAAQTPSTLLTLVKPSTSQPAPVSIPTNIPVPVIPASVPQPVVNQPAPASNPTTTPMPAVPANPPQPAVNLPAASVPAPAIIQPSSSVPALPNVQPAASVPPPAVIQPAQPTTIVQMSTVIQPTTVIQMSTVVQPTTIVQMSTVIQPTTVLQMSTLTQPTTLSQTTANIQPTPSVAGPPTIPISQATAAQSQLPQFGALAQPTPSASGPVPGFKAGVPFGFKPTNNVEAALAAAPSAAPSAAPNAISSVGETGTVSGGMAALIVFGILGFLGFFLITVWACKNRHHSKKTEISASRAGTRANTPDMKQVKH